MSNWKKKKIGKHILIHYFILFLGEHSNVNNVINALLCLCSCFYTCRYLWLITFEIFRIFFFFGVSVSYPNFFGIFIFFLYLQGPQSLQNVKIMQKKPSDEGWVKCLIYRAADKLIGSPQ